jgi:hypothetical protein
VGEYAFGSTGFDQVLRWNGRRWTLVPAPARGGFATGLMGVTCATPASCWAVGERVSRDGYEHNQVVRWNGRRWSLVSVPDQGGATTTVLDELVGVSCTAPASCWAVGSSAGAGSAAQLNQVLHWNGRRWSLVSVPQPGGTTASSVSVLVGVSCPARASCWAVGSYVRDASAPQLNQVLHWNGRKWSRVSVPSPSGFSELFGVSCPAPGSCWAVGAYLTYVGSQLTALNQALHWNGRRWSLVAVPDQDGTGQGSGNQLTHVSCTSPASCWAVGSSGNVFGRIAGIELNQALHWNGRKWSLAATPDPGGTTLPASNGLMGVSCASAASCWAVGSEGPFSNEALHWNGSRWSAR